MAAKPGSAVRVDASVYMDRIPDVLGSRISYALWALTNPIQSRLGGRSLWRSVDDSTPAIWAQELAGKRVLVVGSGPSLDRVDDSFFANFDTAIHINFALVKRRSGLFNYFFTTDLGVMRQFLERQGVEPFHELGKDRCVVAPVFFDQWRKLTRKGKDLFTALRFDAAYWRTQRLRLFGQNRLPLIVRYHPRQPDWDSFELPKGGRTLPVMDHTSALTAVLFAATQSASEISLIGCDFSDGRSKSLASLQDSPKRVFAGAEAELHNLAQALSRHGVIVTNHSWLV